MKDFNQKATTWDEVSVDSGGPWAFIDHTEKRALTSLTIIGLSAGSFEICRCPKPCKIICDQGSEFKLEFKEQCDTHKIMRFPTSLRNPQRNAFVRRMHLELLSVLRKLASFDVTWKNEPEYGMFICIKCPGPCDPRATPL